MRGKRVKQLRKMTREISGQTPTQRQFRRVKKDYAQGKITIKKK
jgi:hypothetical protein